MARGLTPALRSLVTERAGGRCEYCLLPEAFCAARHEPDHIIPLQHGGQTVPENLALACLRCNRYKGPNAASYDPVKGALTALFNPRVALWEQHFQWDGGEIKPLTPMGRVTVRILRLNHPYRVAERSALQDKGVFP